MQFAPHTDQDVQAMLEACGLGSIDDLFGHVPEGVRLDRELDMPEGLSEMALLAEMRRMAARNRGADDLICFAGGGAYDHYIPSVVWAMTSRSELYTSYTPYQPEVSQGVLQALFEFQSLVCELTGLDVSNASLYDGPTSLVEAVHMSRAATGRDRVLLSSAVDRRYREALETIGRASGLVIDDLPAPDGRTSVPDVGDVGDEVAAVIVQHPNVWGILDRPREVFAAAHEAGARAVQVFDPLSLGVLAPPGEVGADIAVGEGQGLGNHLNYGGPYLGLIAARQQEVRRMPGRIVGATVDVDGRPGYVLTLQAREQHIRREKATSNICTNQTLMAIAASVYLGWLGPDGIRELGRQCAAKARYAASRFEALSNARLAWPEAEVFKEFAVRPSADPLIVQARLVEAGFLVGPVVEDTILVAVTERRTRDEIDALAKAFEEAAG